MTDLDTHIKPTWCPGCGDFGIWAALKNAFGKMGWGNDDALIVYGIGCHGHMVNFLKVYGFEGLHGRPIPVAVGAKLANHKLNVLVVAGDGDTYGEGIVHLIAAIRANHNLTCIIHNNQVYGLTIGQKSPTAPQGFKTKSTPSGTIEMPLNPLALALALNGTFVARGFAGDINHLTDLIVAGVEHNGFALIDVLQPCVTFNKIHTYEWYRERIYKLPPDQPKDDQLQALNLSMQTERLPIGIFYQNKERLTYEQNLPQLAGEPMVKRDITHIDINHLLSEFV